MDLFWMTILAEGIVIVLLYCFAVIQSLRCGCTWFDLYTQKLWFLTFGIYQIPMILFLGIVCIAHSNIEKLLWGMMTSAGSLFGFGLILHGLHKMEMYCIENKRYKWLIEKYRFKRSKARA